MGRAKKKMLKRRHAVDCTVMPQLSKDSSYRAMRQLKITTL